ncbi:OmpW/AlkL family protein [Tsuneonella mangrovi]|uniref:OmpW/AlkL family protein n=1 Tax=Tsuneonella mangrovi TaxID=1982042 RepID=UPI000BA25C8D|nr:OmpW family outer membrane protein [Tsuneonella mangrovi]
MKTCLAAVGIALAAFASQPAIAKDGGKLQVKVLGTAVLPDGKITKVNTDLVGLPSDLQTTANDNYVPTIAIEYFATPSVSVETICCMTEHDVDATTGLPGAELVSNAKLIPATVTLKYHFNPEGISPYIGAGPSFFWWVDKNPGAATIPLGVTNFDMTSKFGVALQAGVDVPINSNGLSISLDAKKYFVSTTARWYAGSTKVIETEHKLDPWVLSAGLAFRF